MRQAMFPLIKLAKKLKVFETAGDDLGRFPLIKLAKKLKEDLAKLEGIFPELSFPLIKLAKKLKAH